MILIARSVILEVMTRVFLTPLHHVMIMVSSAAFGPRRYRLVWRYRDSDKGL